MKIGSEWQKDCRSSGTSNAAGFVGILSVQCYAQSTAGQQSSRLKLADRLLFILRPLLTCNNEFISENQKEMRKLANTSNTTGAFGKQK